MDIVKKLTQIIEPTTTEMGYDLVRVQMQGDDANRTLQVMAERKDRANMMVDDCEKLSRAISALLDVEDPIDNRYLLEVTSPGIDRPLMTADDYKRFAGFEFKVETITSVNGRKRFKGKLLGISKADVVTLDFEGQEVPIALSNINKAKLVLTDELVASFLKNAEKK